jgi:hypothetical protein
MPVPSPTTDEIVELLKRTSLTTVLVEGTDDAAVYRHMETLMAGIKATILPCGGRTALLAVFSRRTEFQAKAVAFLADKDMWLFSGVPPEYSDIVWTQGYSLENDLYHESDIERLLTIEETATFRNLIDLASKWFAFQVENYKKGLVVNVALHISAVVTQDAQDLSPLVRSKYGYADPPEATYLDIRNSYTIKLRGHLLFQALVRILSMPSRGSTYSHQNILELCAKARNHPGVQRIVAHLTRKLT